MAALVGCLAEWQASRNHVQRVDVQAAHATGNDHASVANSRSLVQIGKWSAQFTMIVMFLLLPQGSEPKVPHLSGQGNAPGLTEAATGIASALSKAVAGLVTVLLLFGCDLVGQAPDPAMVQQQIEALRTQEREVVRNTIVDPARADRFLHLVAERDQLIAQSREALEAYRDQMSALNADYHADRAGFESLLADFNTRREHAQAQFVSIISRMKAEATAEEWKEIAAFQTKRLNPRELTYRQAEEGG